MCLSSMDRNNINSHKFRAFQVDQIVRWYDGCLYYFLHSFFLFRFFMPLTFLHFSSSAPPHLPSTPGAVYMCAIVFVVHLILIVKRHKWYNPLRNEQERIRRHGKSFKLNSKRKKNVFFLLRKMFSPTHTHRQTDTCVCCAWNNWKGEENFCGKFIMKINGHSCGSQFSPPT